MVVVGVICLGLGFASLGDDDEKEAAATPTTSAPRPPRTFSPAAAEIACEDAVRERLKSPSTADFPDTNYRQESSGVFDVRGTVDSQNGFGATVRSIFGCTVTPINADRYTITVDELFSN